MGKKKDKQASHKEIVEGFNPSTGDESYLQTPVTGEMVKQEWASIRSMWKESREHAEKAVILFMDIGDKLIKLRDGYTNPQFGKMRKVHVPELSRNDALRAMNLARNRDRFTLEGPTPSVSVMAELVHASDELVDEVLADTREAATTADKDKKAPTVKEVRKKVKAESVEDFEDSIIEQNEQEYQDANPEDDDEVESSELLDIGPLVERVEKVLGMTHPQRINIMSEEELDTFNAFLVLGFNPLYDGDYPCAREVFHCAVGMHLEHCTEEEAEITSTCAKMLEAEIW